MIIAAALTAIIACNAYAVHDGDTLRCGGEREALRYSASFRTVRA